MNNLTNNSNNVETADPMYDCPRNNREIRLRNLFPKIFILFIMFSLFHFFIISKMSEAITLNTNIGIAMSARTTNRDAIIGVRALFTCSAFVTSSCQ